MYKRQVHAFNTDGIPQSVFADGATSISTGVPGANGLQFSSSQSNLWNITDQRAGDAGHFGGNSLRFGDIERNIDLPGGTQGSVFSNEIDLASFTASDQPHLYFNYFMTAEELETPVKTDTFRVFVSDDSEASEDKGGWVLVASSDEAALPEGVEPLFNNSFQDIGINLSGDLTYVADTFVPPNGERDTFPPIADIPPFDEGQANIEEPIDWFRYPELDERQGTWRQARIDLSQFAGSDSLRLRFDFSTAGSFDLGDLGGVELKAVEAAKLSDGQTFTVDNVTFEIDMGVGVTVPAGAGVVDGDVLTLLSTEGQLIEFEFDNDGLFDASKFQVPFESLSNANAVAASLETVLGSAGFNVARTDPFDGRLQFQADQVETAFVNDSGLTVFGSGLDLGVELGNVPVSISLDMSSEAVAAVVGQAFVENLGEDIDANYVVTGNVIRLVGDDVSDPGPFGIADVLPGDERGAFTSPFGSPAYRGLENLFRYYEIGEDDEIDLTVLPFVNAPATDDDEFPEDFAVQFEGVYVDDIVIGFAARGEESTDLRPDYAFTDPDSFPDLPEDPEINPRVPNLFAYHPQPLQPNGEAVVDSGPYRLEIRTATEDPTVYPINQLDRTVDNTALFAPSGVELFDGRIFQISDGLQTVTFEFNDVSLNDTSVSSLNNVAVNYVPSSTQGAVAASIRDAINISVLDVDAYTSDGVTTFGEVGTQDSRVNLSFDAVVIELDAPNGIEFLSTSLEGSGNRERTPGQLIITQSRISESEGHGVIVQYSQRDLPSYDYYDPFGVLETANVGDYVANPGGAGNLRELNPENITTGIVISNNVISFNGEGAIKYDGQPGGFVMTAPIAGDQDDFPLIEVWDGLTFSVVDRTGLIRQFEWHDLEQSDGHFGPRTPGVDWDAGNVPIMFARSLYATDPLDECPYAPDIQCETRGADSEVDVADRLTEAFERSNLDVKVYRGANSEIFIEGAVAIFPSGPLPWGTITSFISEVTPGQRPFGRIVNNTLVGLGGQFTDNRVDELTPLETSGTVGTIFREVNDHNDIGIDVGDSAVPTLLNNIIANFEIGLSADINALDTVREGLVFQGNTLETLNIGEGDFAIELDMDEPLFVDLLSGNFYPAEGSRVIDSSVDSLEERPFFQTIKSAVGISPSPILTPTRDVLGQLREDDPSVEPQDGQGRNAFKDRGAIDRVDFVGPTVILQNPRDNDALGLDQDPASSVVALSPLANLELFEIEFQDTSQLGGAFDGTGVDPASLDNVVVLQDGVALFEGTDYSLDFDATNSILRIIPTSGNWPAGRTYEVILDSVGDIAGNAVRDNQVGGGVKFTITTQLGTDFGDARDEYPSASHDIAEGFFLGNSVTPDAGDQFDRAASLDGGDDGVLLPFEFVRSEANSITVQASAAGVLDAWFDFNANRIFESSEYVFSNVTLDAGANELSVSLPQNSAGGELFARFRFTSEGISTPGGFAPDGEVEDYVIPVEGGALWQNVSNPNDVDDDGFLSPKDVLLVIRELELARASDSVTRELNDPFVPPNIPSSIGFVDVNGDGFVSPRDVRAVIDAVNDANDLANNNFANGEPPLDAALAAQLTTSLTVDPIGEILKNPTVDLNAVVAAPPVEVLDDVFTNDDDDLVLEIAAASEENEARGDVFADLDLFSDD